ncbi:hypothetical protein [Pararhodonellum marinum]|uniref:hypothetical protein n=1 Tax=Pararhodonellum marinum TaxID=2755358 RepID=UPI00188E1DB6|nr:hypothetical protein [Pararhodonellum marinum]
MNRKDKKYQNAVDMVAKELSLKTINELISMPDWGSIENHDNIQLGYSKWKRDDDILHIHILAQRAVFPFPRLCRKYHAGIAIENGNIRTLTDKELGEYD